MWVTYEESIEMYAQFLNARYGTRAMNEARNKAKSLEQQGDYKGQKAWNDVADAIDRRGHENLGALHR
ncbi:MAG TPA: hypothetical protein VGF53_08515 [Pseudolabrys sp.]|jgi:hypothetical protein